MAVFAIATNKFERHKTVNELANKLYSYYALMGVQFIYLFQSSQVTPSRKVINQYEKSV